MNLFTNYNTRELILNSLSIYQEKVLEGLFKNISFLVEEQFIALNKMFKFIQDNPNCFLRECLIGHVTGSAFIINSDYTKILFTNHAKLRKWIQLGGHCDGNYQVFNVAYTEAQEESGINDLKFIDYLNFPNIYTREDFSRYNYPIPFDIDVHEIPMLSDVPKHEHYDIRYLLIANESENLILSDESLDLKWILISEVEMYTKEISILRQLEKLKLLIKLFNNK